MSSKRIEKDQGAILPTSLDQARVKSIPPSIYYIPNFISEAEEALINDKVRRQRIALGVFQVFCQLKA